MPRLDEITTSELLDELAGRFDAVIFSGLCDLGHHQETTQHYYSGGRVTAMGLYSDGIDILHKQRPITGDLIRLNPEPWEEEEGSG
jgi:hypothetical protein